MVAERVFLDGSQPYTYCQPKVSVDETLAWELWDNPSFTAQLKYDGERGFIWAGEVFNKSGRRIMNIIEVPQDLTAADIVLECEIIRTPGKLLTYHIFAAAHLEYGYHPERSSNLMRTLPLPLDNRFFTVLPATEYDIAYPTDHPLSEGIVFRHKVNPWMAYKYKPQWVK